MRPLLDVLPEPLMLLERDGRLLHVNPAARHLLGLPLRPLALPRLHDLLDEPAATVEGLLAQGWRSGHFSPARARWRIGPRSGQDDGVDRIEPCRFVMARVGASDAHPPALLLRLQPGAAASGRFLALTERAEALSREVARRREAEAALQERSEWLQVVLRSIGDAVIATDTGARVLFMNPVAERLCGWLGDEARGQPVDTVMHLLGADGLALPVHPVSAALQSGRIAGLEPGAQLQARDGTRLPVDDAAGPIVDAAGAMIGAVVVFREIGDRLRAEHQRRELETQLRAAQKMEAIGTLAGGIAHDFNNVLGAILGNVGLARDELEADHPVAPRLAQIDRAGRRARELVRQITAFSRRQPQRLSWVDVGALARDCVSLLGGTLPSSVEIAVDGDAGLPLAVHGDVTQLDQVLMNLCTNAWHALVDGTGRITVSWGLAAGDEPPGLLPGFVPWSGDRRARLSVADDGAGMDSATLGRICEPFFTTRAQVGGTGLGLAVVHGIVAEHRGQMAVRTAPGQGSCFDIYLPWAGADLAPALAPVPSAEDAALHGRGAGRRVLVVDDDEMMRMTLEAMLLRDGYRVRTCPGPQAALSVLLAAPEECDIVVTDHNMPGMTGLSLAAAVRERFPELPIVLTSGYLSEDLSRGAMAIGRLTLLNKEDCFDRLSSLIDTILSSR